jgi:hypothetical protein
LPPIADRVRRDSKEPGDERRAAPLEFRQVHQRAFEHGRRDVFGLFATSSAPDDVRIHPVEAAVVQVDETGRVGLRRLDQRTFINVVSRFGHAIANCRASIE